MRIDALQTLATKEAIYTYNFEGRRYDVGGMNEVNYIYEFIA